MPKFNYGDTVVIISRRIGAEVIDTAPVPCLVKVRIATIDILTGKTSIREENIAENDLKPSKKTKGIILL